MKAGFILKQQRSISSNRLEATDVSAELSRQAPAGCHFHYWFSAISQLAVTATTIKDKSKLLALETPYVRTALMQTGGVQ